MFTHYGILASVPHLHTLYKTGHQPYAGGHPAVLETFGRKFIFFSISLGSVPHYLLKGDICKIDISEL